MLSTTTCIRFGSATLAAGLFLGHGFRAHLVIKSRLRFDTALSPPVRGRAATATIYLVGAGRVATSLGAVHHGRSAWVLPPAEFERPAPAAATFQTWGDPGITLDLHVDAGQVRGPLGLGHGPRPVGPATWDALDALAAAIAPEPSRSDAEAAMRRLLTGLVADGVLAPATLAGPATAPPGPLRFWNLLASAFTRFEPRLTMDELSAQSGLSSRQLRRDARELASVFDLLGGYRDGLTVIRLRVALLLLSAPDATVTDVAVRVGYGSADALGRAFRDAGLPSPAEVRQRVRYPD